ncbi:Thylakoid soluble phosphoprotein TSP9 [Heracleum sosnowskyi]|uniref:Thylakoid soluble phosphoprotein TSP9 n=1 Tax=Heracleum sosnowskyi TaxID=360622 RepID=A0AAD8J2U3_9APIA|nr:Thylakoid soluble phosphoprotein TSP9 [Heracleum sosnowskyi]
MASLMNTLMFSPAVIPGRKRLSTTKTYATAAKGSGGGSEEKSLWDFVLGAIAKEEQLYEVDPLLQKVDEKPATNGTTGTRKGSVVVPPPKKESGGFGGFGGLFAKKE